IQLLAAADDSPAGVGGSPALINLDKRLGRMGVERSADLASRLESAVGNITANARGVTGDVQLREIVGASLGVQWFRDLHREIREAASGRYERIAILVDNLDKAWERGADFEATSRFLLALLSGSGQFKKALVRGSEHLDLTLGVFLRADIYEVMTRY